MLWTSLVFNVATIAVALRKRMMLYALLNAIFLFLVTGQGFQIASDLDGRYSVQYLFHYMNDYGFEMAKQYVFWCSLFALVVAVIARGFPTEEAPASTVRFEPPPSFYFKLILFLMTVSIILVFAVVGLQAFLHSSRPGYQSGATVFIVLLIIGIIPLLLKILTRTRVKRSDTVCAIFASAVTTGFSRIHIFLYLSAVLLAFYYASGRYRRGLSAGVVVRLAAIGTLGFAVFFGIGSLRDAQNFTNGSLSDLISYLAEHPEKSLLSIQYNYRVGIEGMSGIAGAFTQSLSTPNAVRHDYGATTVLQAAVLASPGIIKTHLTLLTQVADDLNWYSSSIVPTGAETFLVSFGWLAIVLYPLAIYLLGWFLPRKVLAKKSSPLRQLITYILFACGIFFARGSLASWIAFSVSYTVVVFCSWPFFRRHLQRI